MEQRTTKTIVILILITVLALVCYTKINTVNADAETVFTPIILNNYDAGWHWQQPSEVVLEPFPFEDPVSVIDNTGYLHLFWDSFSTPRFIYHKFLTDSGWTDAIPIAQPLGTSYAPFAPYVDSEGHIHLVWRNWLGIGIDSPYRILYAEFDGASWSSVEELYRTATGSVQAIPHTNQEGQLLVSILDRIVFTYAYQLRREINGWFRSQSINPGHYAHAVWPDKEGGLHFFGTFDDTSPTVLILGSLVLDDLASYFDRAIDYLTSISYGPSVTIITRKQTVLKVGFTASEA